MSSHQHTEIRKVNILAIISFFLPFLMVFLFFLPSRIYALKNYGHDFVVLRNSLDLLNLQLGLAALITGIYSIISMNKYKFKGLWMLMSIIGMITGLWGTLFMISGVLYLMAD
jgi:hypothetical protein